MKTLKRILLLLSTTATLSSCINNKSAKEIEGVWISTEETSTKLLHGTRKGVLQIIQNEDGTLAGHGYFLWNGDYRSEWELVNFEFDNQAHLVTLKDTDGDSYKGIVDLEQQKITGAMYLENDHKEPLDFIPAGNEIITTLFHPRNEDEAGKVRYAYTMPEQLDDGLQTSSINPSAIDSIVLVGLLNKIINQEFGRLASLLILKDDKLVVEEYFYGYDRTRLHPIHSCTKSITTLLLGIALEQHKNVRLDQPIFDFFPAYDSLKTKENKSITLKHALTMTAGFQWNEFPKEMYETDDWFHYILSRPMETKPGETFHYNSGGTILIGGVIHFLEGKQANAFAEEVLFGPLGISEYVWSTHKDGTPQCGAGLQMLPRDMAKIGLLVLNDGKWNDMQLVPEAWIHESTKPRVPESDFFDYGYQWWHRSKQNKPWWDDPKVAQKDEHDMIIALGWGGQYIVIVNDLNLVVVTTASDYDNDGMAIGKIRMVIEDIIPAITRFD
jgi:CubicO group peptidase (beta-lactamase class C family)